MRIILFVLIILVGCTPRLPNEFISASEYDRSIRGYRDPLSNEIIYSVQLGAKSVEQLAYRSRFTMKMEVLKSISDEHVEYSSRFVLQSSPEEWPIEDEAFWIVDNNRYPLELIHVNPRNTAQISGSAMDGNVSISTNELQLLRIETVLPIQAVESIGSTSTILLGFHSGKIPITFRFDELNVAKLLALTNIRRTVKE